MMKPEVSGGFTNYNSYREKWLPWESSSSVLTLLVGRRRRNAELLFSTMAKKITYVHALWEPNLTSIEVHHTAELCLII